MASSGQMSSTDRASCGRIIRIPEAATALACFFRRSKTAGEEKGCKSGLEMSQNGKARLASFVEKGRTVEQLSSEYRYSRATSSPSNLFVSRVAESSGILVGEKAAALKHKETGHPTTESEKRRQPIALVQPDRSPDEEGRFRPFFDDSFLVSTVLNNDCGCLAVGGDPSRELSLPRPQRICKRAPFRDAGEGETDIPHGQGTKTDTRTSAPAAPSVYLYKSPKREERDSSTGVRDFDSSMHDPDPPQTGEQQHAKALCAGSRRAAAAGRLSSKEERPSQEKRRICLNGERSIALLAELGVAISCRKGLKRVPSNQDDFFAYSCDSWGLYGIFDGHGRGGHVVANFVQWHLPSLIHGFLSQTDNLKAALRFAFNRVDYLLKEASEAQRFDSASSGSTASVVLHKRREKKLYVAYVGDSTVVLARRNSQGQLIAHTVTKDHRPDDPTERSRIERLGGEIRRPVGHVPYRVFVRGKDYPGLAMSRSLGDFMGHSAGVTMEPDILELELTEGHDEMVVMCTDGVWEFISPHEAVEIVSPYSFRQAAEAVRALSCEAWKRWLKEDGHSVDDITVLLIHLFPPMFRGYETQRSKSGENKRRFTLPFEKVESLEQQSLQENR